MSAEGKSGVEEFDIVDVNTINILVVGPSGSGKSEVINSLKSYGREMYTKADMSPSSVTQENIIQVISSRIKKDSKEHTINFYDTRGLSDSSKSFKDMIQSWNTMIKLELNKVHYVLYVMPLDRLSQSLLNEMMMMTTRLMEYGMRPENVVVLLNKCDFYEQNIIDSYEAKLRTMASVPVIIRDAEMIKTCFINPSLVVDEIKDVAKSKMITSTNEVLRRIIKPVEPFHPKSVIIGIEEMEAADKAKRAAEASKRAFCALM